MWITEGEWCADQLNRTGYYRHHFRQCGQCSAADWTPLTNRNVIIWPDNDAAGLKYAQAVTEQLRALHCTVQWVDIARFEFARLKAIAWIGYR